MAARFFKVAFCAIATILYCAVVSPALGIEGAEQNAPHGHSLEFIEVAIATDSAQEAIANDEHSSTVATSATNSSKKASSTKNRNGNIADPWVWVSNSYITILLVLWSIIIVVQSFMAYGTAFYKTRMGGNNGVALFGWLIVFNLAAIIPFLGAYLWTRAKNKARSLE